MRLVVEINCSAYGQMGKSIYFYRAPKKCILDFAIQFVYASLYILYTKMSSGFVFFDIMQFRFQRKSRNAIHREAIVHLPPLVVRHWP